MKLRFKCPRCGGDKLEEVTKDVILEAEIILDDEGNFDSYGYKTTHSDSGVDSIQCRKCGHDTGLSDVNDIAEYLEDNEMSDKGEDE
jgi:transcription elongation factor Elf1